MLFIIYTSPGTGSTTFFFRKLIQETSAVMIININKTRVSKTGFKQMQFTFN